MKTLFAAVKSHSICVGAAVAACTVEQRAPTLAGFLEPDPPMVDFWSRTHPWWILGAGPVHGGLLEPDPTMDDFWSRTRPW